MSRSEQASRGLALCDGLARESPMSPIPIPLALGCPTACRTAMHPATAFSRHLGRSAWRSGSCQSTALVQELEMAGHVQESLQRCRALHTNNLVFERMAPGLLNELRGKAPKHEMGHRPDRMNQWLTADAGDPMLAQHFHSLMMLQRVAIANGYGWQRFLHMVDKAMPRRGDTLPLPFDLGDARPHLAQDRRSNNLTS